MMNQLSSLAKSSVVNDEVLFGYQTPICSLSPGDDEQRGAEDGRVVAQHVQSAGVQPARGRRDGGGRLIEIVNPG
jgi:hypothetical protein